MQDPYEDDSRDFSDRLNDLIPFIEDDIAACFYQGNTSKPLPAVKEKGAVTAESEALGLISYPVLEELLKQVLRESSCPCVEELRAAMALAMALALARKQAPEKTGASIKALAAGKCQWSAQGL